MQKTIISDASCIILLDTIGELPILQNLFGTIITTSEIALEFGKPLPAWFEIRQSTNKKLQTTLQEILEGISKNLKKLSLRAVLWRSNLVFFF